MASMYSLGSCWIVDLIKKHCEGCLAPEGEKAIHLAAPNDNYRAGYVGFRFRHVIHVAVPTGYYNTQIT